MQNIEFRRNKSYYSEPSNEPSDQMTLPLDVRLQREVHWMHGVTEIKQRLMGSKAVTRIIMEHGRFSPILTYIDTDSISELQDPNLRYALRFADAASAVGQTQTGPYSSGSHDVSVIATDDGVDSKLISASYSGIGRGENGTFMDNLRCAEPHKVDA